MVKMKVLIISGQPPSPFSGAEIRLLNLLRHLAGNYDFTVIAPICSKDDPKLSHADCYCRFIPAPIAAGMPRRSRLYWILNAWYQVLLTREPKLVADYAFPPVHSAVDKLVKSDKFDIVQIQQFYMAQYLPDRPNCPTILDVDNLWSKLSRRLVEISPERRLTRRIQAVIDQHKVYAYEKSALKKFDACLAVCHEDETYIRKLAPRTITAIVPNGVDTTYYVPQFGVGGERTILFTGAMAWSPNIDAVKFLVSDILPIVRQYDPSVTLQIVGRNPTSDVRELAQAPWITVTGFVEDIRPYLAASTVYVVPLRAGAGTRLKILEALAMGKAVVSTSLGAEGLEVTDGKNILIADEPGEIAAQIIALLRNQSLREELGRNGRQLVESHYDWSAIASKLGAVYSAVRLQKGGAV